LRLVLLVVLLLFFFFFSLLRVRCGVMWRDVV